MPADDFDAVVVGAGVGGAAAALALAQHPRLRVLVVERRAGPGNVNRGDSLLPAATRRLASWGVLGALRAAGAREVRTMEVVHFSSGRLFEAPVSDPDEPHPYLCLSHPEIERVLIAAAQATGRVEVRFGVSVARLIQEGGRCRGVELETSAAGGRERVRAKLVIGADGSRSRVRADLGISLVTRPYSHGFFVIDLEADPADRTVMQINLHPDGGVLVVPGPGRIGVAALVHPRHEALFRAGPTAEKVAEIVRRVPGCADRQAFAGAHLYQVSRGHAPSYIRPGAALLGDAVHVTNPTAGQGMTMAIEDAACLGTLVAEALSVGSEGVIDQALLRYQNTRHPQNAARVDQSHWMSRFYASGGRWGDALRHRVFSLGGTRWGKAVHRAVWTRVAGGPPEPAAPMTAVEGAP